MTYCARRSCRAPVPEPSLYFEMGNIERSISHPNFPLLPGKLARGRSMCIKSGRFGRNRALFFENYTLPWLYLTVVLPWHFSPSTTWSKPQSGEFRSRATLSPSVRAGEGAGRGIRSRFSLRSVLPRCCGAVAATPRPGGAERHPRVASSRLRPTSSSLQLLARAAALNSAVTLTRSTRAASHRSRRGIAATAPQCRRSKQKGTLIRQCSTRLASVGRHAGSRVARSRNRYATAAETAVGGRWRDAFFAWIVVAALVVAGKGILLQHSARVRPGPWIIVLPTWGTR